MTKKLCVLQRRIIIYIYRVADIVLACIAKADAEKPLTE
jgi:hypothetical protein